MYTRIYVSTATSCWCVCTHSKFSITWPVFQPEVDYKAKCAFVCYLNFLDDWLNTNWITQRIEMPHSNSVLWFIVCERFFVRWVFTCWYILPLAAILFVHSDYFIFHSCIDSLLYILFQFDQNCTVTSILLQFIFFLSLSLILLNSTFNPLVKQQRAKKCQYTINSNTEN